MSLKVLIVCKSKNNKPSPFISEQVLSLQKLGVQCDYFFTTGKGIQGYLKSYFKLRSQLKKNKYDLIHGHFGLSGFICILQRKTPVVVTFHGSDIHQKKNLKISRFVMKMASQTIFVTEKLTLIAKPQNNYSIIPCGVDTEVFREYPKEESKRDLGLHIHQNYILFSSSFQNSIKNPELALAAVESMENFELIELTGYSRLEVAQLMNASDICLMTSHDEGSPQFIKEAMACNRPIVATDVGDVNYLLNDVSGTFISLANLKSIREALRIVHENGHSNGRERIMNLKLDLESTAQKVLTVYNIAIKK